MVDKQLIKENFSRCAPYYDKYSSIQQKCARALMAGIKGKSFAHILEIGCGTGNYTRLLKEKFPQAEIKAIDISVQMLAIAKDKLLNKKIEFITADGEKVDFAEQFDFIGANASFQWFENLEGALSRYQKMLKESGLIAFSIFGPGTFKELDASLSELFSQDARTYSSIFFPRTRIEQILRRLFREVEIKEKIYQERHNSISELLRKIKYTGTRGNGFNKKGFWTPEALLKLEKTYKRRFHEIKATHQVFFCQGAK